MVGALGQRDFRLLWFGALSAFVGFFTSVVVKAVVAFELTHSNTAVGWVVFARGVAMGLFGPIGGATADRVSKRALLLGCQTLTAAMFVGLGFLMASGKLGIEMLVASALLVGITFAFMGPTRQAYAVELVPEGLRGNAVATNQVALNASRVGGPALAGYLLAHPVGATGAFYVMAALYGLAVVSHGFLPRYAHPPGDEVSKGVLSDVRAGLTHVSERPHLRALLLYFVFAIMLGFPYVVVLPGLVEHGLHQDADAVSVLFSTSAVGGLVASLVTAPFADRRHALLAHRGSGYAFAASLLWLSLADNMWMANGAVIAIGLSTGVMTTLNGAMLLRASEPRYLGRVMSLAMLAFAGFGLTGLPVGALADALGERACLQAMAGAVLLTTLYFSGRIRNTAPDAEQTTPAS